MKTMKWEDNQIYQFNHEILWLLNEIATKNLSEKQVANYLYQIRHKELNIAFNELAS